MLSDLRHAFRQLARSPSFTVTAIATLALGIGLNVSMFSLMDLLLLRPLPYPGRNHLVRIYRTTPQSQTAGHTVADYLTVARDARRFADVAAYRMWGYTLQQAGRPPVNLNALRVSGNFFSVLGMPAELGRTFTAEDDRPGNHVIILSHATWEAQFGGDRSVIGRTVRIDSEPTTIVGVMPEAFSSVFLWGPGDAFRPFGLTDAEKRDRTDSGLDLLARVHSGLTLPQINARFAALAAQLNRHRPPAQSADGLRAASLQSAAVNPIQRGMSWLLLGLAGSVLLIACGNLANLQLARAISRAQEFAIRAALGASRRRLLRPLLCESTLLAAGGGVLGVLLAAWTNAWVSSRMSANGLVSFHLTIDWRVLTFALGLSAATGLAFGIVPGWVMARIRANDALKTGHRGHTGGRAQHRFRHGLIVAQVALALMLLAGAGIFIRGLRSMLTLDIGWDRHGLLQCVLGLPSSRYPGPLRRDAFDTQLQERLAALPGVQNVALAWTLPIFKYLTTRGYLVEGRAAPPAGREPVAAVNGITPSYLPTLKIRLIAGRNFTEADDLKSPPVVIINESMARALFPHENPIGHRLGGLDPGHREWAEIVGVVRDVRFAFGFIPKATRFLVLRPLAQEPWGYLTVAIRAPHAAALAGPVRRVVAGMDPELPVRQLSTVDSYLRTNGGGFSTIDTILLAFALLGLSLAMLGLYGVISRLVIQRTPEIGVRVALGAQTRDVARLILVSGLRVTLAGAAIGLLGAIGFGRLVGGILPDLPIEDPLAIAGATLLLLAAALFACWLPARRAARVDPMIALRAE